MELSLYADRSRYYNTGTVPTRGDNIIFRVRLKNARAKILYSIEKCSGTRVN